jgi:hypothetical protein
MRRAMLGALLALGLWGCGGDPADLSAAGLVVTTPIPVLIVEQHHASLNSQTGTPTGQPESTTGTPGTVTSTTTAGGDPLAPGFDPTRALPQDPVPADDIRPEPQEEAPPLPPTPY